MKVSAYKLWGAFLDEILKYSGLLSVITGTPISSISGIKPPVAPLATKTPSNGLRTVGSVGLADLIGPWYDVSDS